MHFKNLFTIWRPSVFFHKNKIKITILRGNEKIKKSVYYHQLPFICHFLSEDYTDDLGRRPCLWGLVKYPNMYAGIGICSKKYEAIYNTREKPVCDIMPEVCDVVFKRNDIVQCRDWSITINTDADFLKLASNLETESNLRCLR